MLRPQYTRRPYEILVIGPHNSGKKTLATQLLKAKDVYFSIKTASSLPKKPLTRIDFVLITVDLTQARSISLLKECLRDMTGKFLTNKTAIIVTKVDKPHLWQIEMEDVQAVIESFCEAHIFYVNLTNEIEKKRICEQVSRMIMINTLQFKNIDTMQLKSLEVYNLERPAEEGDQS